MVSCIELKKGGKKMNRKIKIVADSSANILKLDKVAFASAPLKIITDNREFADTNELDVSEMISYLYTNSGKSKTSCPNPNDWLEAFGDADDIFCVTITSGLSGSYNSACVAKKLYEEQNIGRRVFVIDSLSAGPELRLIIEKLVEMIELQINYEEICKSITKYQQTTGLIFSLESLKNFAANGRVSPIVAKLVGVLGIRFLGKASDEGTLQVVDKCRGEEKTLAAMFEYIKKQGLTEGRVQIAHCENEKAAIKLKAMINENMPKARVGIETCRGLCSYYAERGGMLVAFENF